MGLDTTFLADVLRQDRDALRQLKAFAGAAERHVTTALNAAELYQGAASSKRGSRMITEIDELLGGLVVLPLNRESTRVYAELALKLSAAGTPLPFLDLLIGATLLAHGESRILTRNAKDFDRIPGLIAITY